VFVVKLNSIGFQWIVNQSSDDACNGKFAMLEGLKDFVAGAPFLEKQ
jgi:hypothetical protein